MVFASVMLIAWAVMGWWGRNKLARRRRADMKAAAVRWEPAGIESYNQAMREYYPQTHAAGFALGVALAARGEDATAIKLARVGEGWCEYCGTTGRCSVCGSEHGE